MGTQAATTNELANGLRELSDPEFITQWSLTRQRLALLPEDNPERLEVKRCYDALFREYRRRMHGNDNSLDGSTPNE